MLDLVKDPKRSQHRAQWLKFAEIFDDLYEKNPKWGNRPSALFRAAAAYDELARRSHVVEDAEKALSRYESLAGKHPSSSLADDALMEAAKLANENLRDGQRAKTYLDRIGKDFAKGDMAGAARAYTGKLTSETPKTATPKAEPVNPDSGKMEAPKNEPVKASGAARITQVEWQSRRNLVRITVELDRPVSWVVYSQRPNEKSGRPARLVVDLAGAAPDSRIKPSAKVSKSVLTRLRVDMASTGHTRMLLDFTDLKRFTVKTENSPFRLIISATDSEGTLPNGKALGETIEERARGGPQSDIAAQLGLGVRTVIVDPGHGGNDPGTEHNGVVERIVTLHVAKKVADELRRMGFNARLTRSANERVELQERATLANSAKGDVLISIHVNASATPDTQGFETYFLDFASSTSAGRLAAVENSIVDKNLGDMERIMADLMLGARTQESRRLATAVQSGTVQYMRKKKLAIRDGGLRSAPFHVLLGAAMPGILVELGYCTNKTEAVRLKDSEYLDALARGIAEGVRNYSNKLR